MLNKSTVVTAFLLLAGSFQLSLFGLLPYHYKIIGDVILFSISVYALQLGWLRPLSGRWSAYVYRMSILFIALSVFLILYSIVIWGDLLHTLTWSRRWLISGMYMLLSSSIFVRHIHWKMVKTAFFIFPAIAAIAQYMERSGIYDFAGIRSNMEWQGGYVVIKLFTTTAALIMITFLLNVYRLFKNFRPQNIILFLGWSYVFFDLINFRGYWIASLLSILLTLLGIIFLKGAGFNSWRTRVVSIILCALILVFGFGYGEIVKNINGRIAWLQSAVTDADKGSGNIQWRLNRDASRLEAIWNGPDLLYKVYGIGFVGEGSSGYKKLGFTSETNDSGWVEVLLTGGFPAAIIITLLWGGNVIRLFVLCRERASPFSLASLSAAVASAVLMYTSNYLLWDFGFVPMFWIQALALAFDHQKQNAVKPFKEEPLLLNAHGYRTIQLPKGLATHTVHSKLYERS